MDLALFDLDHTLIPFDSGMAWTAFLEEVGALPPGAQARYLAGCQDYVACTLDIHALHRAGMAPLAAFTPAQLTGWQQAFESRIAARVPAAMRELVQRHRDAGDLCAIVTATSRLIAEPFACVFGVPHLLATEAVFVRGAPTGEIDGLPCYREHKVTRVEQWLRGEARMPAGLAGFERSWFYSDSFNDLPLLQAVSHPVAVRPDGRLRALATELGWQIDP